MDIEVLDEAAWRARAAAHAARVDAYLRPHLERRRDRVKHPVHDFLFTYYSHRPAQLRRWHPGYGTGLDGGEEYADLKGYEGVVCPTTRHGASSGTRPGAVAVSEEYVVSQRPLLAATHALLTATAGRPPSFGCFGLHEWAMVHRADETRHDRPLRLGRAGTDAVVESHRIACSHFDAFRFFTPSARPLNTLSPAPDDRADFEQPGCLHAGMDLYKMSYRLSPLVCSDLVADAFELAWEIRVVDMRAAPYDLTGLTLDPSGERWTPIEIETVEGKHEYAGLQRRFSGRAAAIRTRLIQECEHLLAVPNVGAR